MTPFALYMPAYQAANYLESTLARIPTALHPHIQYLWILDDGSSDHTSEQAHRLAQRYPFVQVRSFAQNRGYGAMVKEGWALALQHGCKRLVCLHADGQYAPEYLEQMLHALDQGLDVVQGSRHLNGGARAGGMPRYKIVAGKALVALENAVFGLRMSDYHSGYLAFSSRALHTIPVAKLSPSFDIDLEMIACAKRRGLAIGERAIPTRYAGEESHLQPVDYGFRVLKVLWRYTRGAYD